MKTIVVSILFVILLGSWNGVNDFLSEQKKYARVRTAFDEKEKIIEQNLQKHGLQSDDFQILIVVYKDSDEFQILAKKKNETSYKTLINYAICARSGDLGPKRKQGDSQVPEGFYHISVFNPSSSFYLSLGVSYPNLADRRKSNAKDLGGDIFIHGSCVTIGCLPMTNEMIKEIYVYAVLAKNNGQNKIPVYIFPFKMTDKNFGVYTKNYQNDAELIAFWTNLKKGYDKFNSAQTELKYSVDPGGDYMY